MTVVHDITTKSCNTCGREISILHPESWAYKRKLGNVNIFWCSWSCLREAEKEGKFDMKKLTLENKKEAVRIALSGGNPLDFIRMCGVSNAANCWSKIKADLKEKDPEAWEKLPKRLPNPVMDRNKEAPADAVTKAALQHPERPIVQIDGKVIIESVEDGFTPEEIDMIKKGVIPATDDQKKFVDMLKGNETIEMPKAEEVIPKELQKHMKPGVLKKREKKFSLPSICNGFEVIGIRGQYGVYSANDEVNYFDFQPFGGELCMSPEEWHEQLDELKRAAKVLGVEL